MKSLLFFLILNSFSCAFERNSRSTSTSEVSKETRSLLAKKSPDGSSATSTSESSAGSVPVSTEHQKESDDFEDAAGIMVGNGHTDTAVDPGETFYLKLSGTDSVPVISSNGKSALPSGLSYLPGDDIYEMKAGFAEEEMLHLHFATENGLSSSLRHLKKSEKNKVILLPFSTGFQVSGSLRYPGANPGPWSLTLEDLSREYKTEAEEYFEISGVLPGDYTLKTTSQGKVISEIPVRVDSDTVISRIVPELPSPTTLCEGSQGKITQNIVQAYASSGNTCVKDKSITQRYTGQTDSLSFEKLTQAINTSEFIICGMSVDFVGYPISSSTPFFLAVNDFIIYSNVPEVFNYFNKTKSIYRYNKDSIAHLKSDDLGSHISSQTYCFHEGNCTFVPEAGTVSFRWNYQDMAELGDILFYQNSLNPQLIRHSDNACEGNLNVTADIKLEMIRIPERYR